jgi:hypothetical protein
VSGSKIDVTKPTATTAYTADVRANFQTAADEITALQGQVAQLAARQQYANTIAAAAPAGTSSATDLMMGLAVVIDPVSATRIVLVVTGTIANSANNGQSFVSMRYGTGAAPVNGAAPVGTVLGQEVQFDATTSGNTFASFSQNALVSGLTPGTSYWFDLSLHANGGTASLTNIQFSAFSLIDPVTLAG